MTPAERDNPKIIDGSRRARIAKGSGVEVSEVNTLINRFFEARKMMTSLATGAMPGMPGIPGARRQPSRSQKKKGGRGVSGNPAKRNAVQHTSRASGAGCRFWWGRVRPGCVGEGDGRFRAAT